MSSRQTTLLGISRRIVSLTLDLRGIARVVADARVTMLLPVRLPLGAERGGRTGPPGAEAPALGGGHRALAGVPRHKPDIPADLGGALDEDAGARTDRANGLCSDFLGAFEDADDPAFGRRAQVAADLGGARDGAAQDVGDRRGQRSADRAGALDGADQRAADGVDDGGQNLTRPLD